MKIIPKSLIAAILVAGCGENPVAPEKPYSGTIPIATGNTWVYQHDYFFHQEAGYRPTHRRNGLLTISINSVSTSAKGDSTFFSATVVDSGEAVNDSFYSMPVRDSNGNDVPTLFHYRDTSLFNHTTDRNYVVTNNILSAVNSYADSLLPFFSYALLPDSTKIYNSTHSSSNFSRLSSCATVTFNSSDTLTLWTTKTSYRYKILDQVSIDSCETRWLENVGLLYYARKNTRGWVIPWMYFTAESYSLISFNGSPVTISK